MDRDQQAAAAVNLLDREQRIIADILSHFRNMVFHATEKVDNAASTGQASYHSFAMELMTQSLTQSTEDLLQLTRQLRELWVVGPLQLPDDGDNEAEKNIDKEVMDILSKLNTMREGARRQMMQEAGGHGTYVAAPLNPPRSDGQPANSGQGALGGSGLTLQQR
ncbi:hypothetical protein GQ53DRAFT_759513 [Thozetella sp. PMI_491]|nr:hypothetical protein GQ53DRAFT_759513 [Thozetella sp. PMI_491]